MAAAASPRVIRELSARRSVPAQALVARDSPGRSARPSPGRGRTPPSGRAGSPWYDPSAGAGYAADAATGRPLRYRLNGPLCLLLTAGAWLVLEGALGFDGAFSARWFGWSVLWCNALGLAAALAAAVGAGWRADEGGRALTADQMGADGEVLTEALKRNSGDAPKVRAPRTHTQRGACWTLLSCFKIDP